MNTQTNPSANQDRIYSIDVDASYVYVTGEDRTESTSAARWRTEKRDITTGNLVTAFDGDGITISQDGADDRPTAILVDASNVYIGGYGTGPGDNQWLIEKRDLTTGLRVSSGFGANDCTATREMDTTSGDRAVWAVQTEDESTNFGHDVFGLDYDGDANVEEAAAANLDFSVTVPTGAAVVSNFYAARWVGGAGGTVRLAMKDYSAFTGATGGRTIVGSTVSISMTYSDPIVAAAVTTGGYPGLMTNPEDYIDTVNNKMNLSLVTTVDGATTDNSTPAWDFAMVSIGWVQTTALLTISGTVYDTDEVTPLATQPALKLSVSGSTLYTTTAAANGTFSFTNVVAPSSGAVMTLWMDTGAGADKGSLVFTYGSSCTGYTNCTGLKLVKDQLRLDSKDGSSLTNTLLAACDNDTGSACADTDIGLTSNSGTLTTTYATSTLNILTGTVFAPGGAIVAQSITIAGTFTAPSSSTISFSKDWTNNGIFTHSSSTVTAVAGTSTTVRVLGSSLNNFYNFSASLPGKTLQFKNATTTTVSGTLTLSGSSGNNMLLKSDSINNRWLLNLTGSATISYATLSDCGCSITTLNPTLDSSDVDAGNNGTCWIFAATVRYGGSDGPTEMGDGGGTPTSGGGQAGSSNGSDGGGNGSTGGGSGGSGSPSP